MERFREAPDRGGGEPTRDKQGGVARRHGISDSQLYAWRKVLGSETHAGFLSVITDKPSPSPEDGSSSSIDIVLANGHRLVVSGPVDPAHVACLLRALAST